MDEQIVGGKWEAAHKLSKLVATNHTGVKDLDSHVTDTAGTPDSLADYFVKCNGMYVFPK